jgi:hypothetical protein
MRTARIIGKPEPVGPSGESIVDVDGGVILGVAVAAPTPPVGLAEAASLGEDVAHRSPSAATGPATDA